MIASCRSAASTRAWRRALLALVVVVAVSAPATALAHADETPGWVRSALGGSSGWAVAAALVLALGYGAAHALSPGHGKSMVAAYLIGREGRPRDAIVLGLTITVAHTLTVFLIGIGFAVALGAGHGNLRVIWWLRTVSGVIVLGMGLVLLFARIRAWMRGVSPHGHDHPHAGDHHHHHPHGHDHDHHAHEHPHSHPHGIDRDGRGLPLWQTVGLGLAGGAIPCPTALAMVGVGAAMGHALAALALVAAFSVGLAISLTAVGLAIVRGSNWIERVGWGRRAVRVAGVVGAVLLVVIGAALSVAPTLEARHTRASRVVVYP